MYRTPLRWNRQNASVHVYGSFTSLEDARTIDIMEAPKKPEDDTTSPVATREADHWTTLITKSGSKDMAVLG